MHSSIIMLPLFPSPLLYEARNKPKCINLRVSLGENPSFRQHGIRSLLDHHDFFRGFFCTASNHRLFHTFTMVSTRQRCRCFRQQLQWFLHGNVVAVSDSSSGSVEAGLYLKCTRNHRRMVYLQAAVIYHSFQYSTHCYRPRSLNSYYSLSAHKLNVACLHFIIAFPGAQCV